MKRIPTFQTFLLESNATLLSGSWVLTKDYRYLATVGNYRDKTLHIEFRTPQGEPATTYYNIEDVYELTPAQVEIINNNPDDFRFDYSLEDDDQKAAQREIKAAVAKHFVGPVGKLNDFQ
jgi:hypothetical protein